MGKISEKRTNVFSNILKVTLYAGMVELAYTLVSKTNAVRLAGSSPAFSTN